MSTPAPTPYESYDTEKLIRYLHGFYHHGGNDEFNLNSFDYRVSLLYLGSAVIFFGGIALIFYFIFLCCRAGVQCCRKEAGCGPNLSRFLLFILTCSMVGMVLCSYVGYGNFVDGMNGVAHDCSKIRDIVENLDDGATSLVVNGNNFEDYVDEASCSGSVLSSNAERFLAYASGYSDILPAPAYLTKLIKLFGTQIPEYVTYLLGFTAASAAVVSLVTIMGILSKSSTLLNLASLFSVLLFLLLIVLIGMELTLSVMFADLCEYGVGQALQDIAERTMGDSSAKVVEYYTTCSGINPLETVVNKTYAANYMLNTTAYDKIVTNDTSCSSFNPLRSIMSEATDAFGTLASMESEQNCASVNVIYFDLVDSVLCGKTVSGLWELWAVHLATGALLYICMFFTSHVKQKCKVLVLMDEEGAVKAIPLGPPLAPNTV